MSEATATCRGCGMILRGKPYQFGGPAYHPDTGEMVPINYYGGFVCSEHCDIKECWTMVESMPGAGRASGPSCYAQERINTNWSIK